MDRMLAKNDGVDIVESVDDMAREQILQESYPTVPFAKPQSYHSTSWGFVNAVLSRVDTLTNGRAGLVQRFSSFVIIGGFSAVVNLVVFYLSFYHIHYPHSFGLLLPNLIASIIAAEVSIMTNFALNDHFTFRYLPGHERTWLTRCARFQATSVTGSILTFLIEFAFTSLLHLPAIIAQAIAIVIVLFYNFTIHHLFTYRHAKAA